MNIISLYNRRYVTNTPLPFEGRGRGGVGSIGVTITSYLPPAYLN